MNTKSERYEVKLFLDSIVEGPGEGHRSRPMIKVSVWAFSQVDAAGRVEEALTRLLQDEIDGDIARRPLTGE